eukprot:CAMPEP_0178459064 /NCGR_PEP_ID=MMETSP0689_2-20121128/47904_1 /TAXON_ID=160604 /ORGANISM="Amphidinium massartii, Strain CS-259" /LENGTH=314 /DNA_ID=CAMNT_0020085463 /DNA_START=107 /DNA_END=1051 /DNA_ORIENTATION=+
MWEDDGSEMVKTEADSNKFVIDGKPGGSPVNALYSKSLASGQYFEIEVLSSEKSAFVGVTTREAFAKGWKCKGLFFGGNLSNGGALVRSQFGEWPKTGMKIGVLTDLTPETATVTFYQDGRCLGPAFVSKRVGGGDVFPVVHTSGEGDSFAISFPDAPAARERQAKDGSKLHPAEGSWAVKRMSVGPELGEFPLSGKMEGQDLGLKVEGAGTPGTFSLAFKVANTVRMVAASASDDSLAPFEKLTPSGQVMATMMMGPPGMMEVEQALTQNLATVHKWLAKDGMLIITGPTLELELEPRSDAPDGLPATETDLP